MIIILIKSNFAAPPLLFFKKKVENDLDQVWNFPHFLFFSRVPLLIIFY